MPSTIISGLDPSQRAKPSLILPPPIMTTIYYTFPVLTPLEQTCTQLDHVGIARFCAANGVSERVACAAYNRACDKRRDIGLWHARERDGKPHSFTITTP